MLLLKSPYFSRVLRGPSTNPRLPLSAFWCLLSARTDLCYFGSPSYSILPASFPCTHCIVTTSSTYPCVESGVTCQRFTIDRAPYRTVKFTLLSFLCGTCSDIVTC